MIAIDFNNSLDVARVIDTDAATGITALFQIALAADGAGMISITLLRDFGAGADIRGPAVIDSAAIAPVPLPAPLALLAGALAGLAGLRGFRRAA